MTLGDRTQSAIVWAVWAGLLLAGCWLVARYGLEIPIADELEWVGVATGHEPLTLGWLWSQHNEHRLFLARLAYLGLGHATGFDFRAGALVNVGLLGLTALLTLLILRRIRGRTILADAFVPMLLLHWGQTENLVWGFQINFTISATLAALVLLTAVQRPGELGVPRAAAMAVLLAALGLCGMHGVVYLPAMAAWLAMAAALRWRRGQPGDRRAAAVIGLLAGLPVALAAFCFVGLQRVSTQPWAGVGPTLRTAVQFLAGGLGPVAKEIWPVSGALVLAACGIALAQGWRAFRRPEQRARAAGMACFVGALAVLALGIGVGRSPFGTRAGFEQRYITLAAPLWLAMFFVNEVLGGGRMQVHVRRTLLLLALAMLPIHMRKGLGYAENFSQAAQRVERDAGAGFPPAALANRYARQMGFRESESVRQRFVWLEEAGLAPFRRVDDGWRRDRRIRVPDGMVGATAVAPAALAPGTPFIQPLDPQNGGRLVRLDVQLGRRRKLRGLSAVLWQIEDQRDGAAVPLASGQIDLAAIAPDSVVSLDFDPIPLAESPIVAFRSAKGASDQPPEPKTAPFAERKATMDPPQSQTPARRLSLRLELPADAPPQVSLEIPRIRRRDGAAPPSPADGELEVYLVVHE